MSRIRNNFKLIFITSLFCIVFLFITSQTLKFYNNEDNYYYYTEKVITRYLKNDPSLIVKEKCDVIHIGFIASGFQSNIWLHTLLKSILFYRINPLHLHIIADNSSQARLETLLDSWQLPNVVTSIYSIDDYLEKLEWIPNNHYSGNAGLMKLLFSEIIARSITRKLIVLDTDLLVLGDIAELWRMFDDFNDKQAIGIVENESDFYLVKNKKRWPALGSGFNSGVMLYDFTKFDRLNWVALWRSTARKYIKKIGKLGLGDQDIINAVIVDNPEILYQVPCHYNTQLSLFTKSSECYKNYRVKIIHWNSPKKFDVENNDAKYFHNLYETFSDMNGNIFRNNLEYCGDKKKSDDQKFKDLCFDFYEASAKKWRTLISFRDFQHTTVENDVTFVGQLSFDRILMVQELAKAWNGPISLSLYLTDQEFVKFNHYIEQSRVLKTRKNIGYHVVFKDGNHYPINLLRNIALDKVVTPFVFLSDIDFVPKKGLYSSLRQTISDIGNMTNKALIVPAFETTRYLISIPDTKERLIKMWDQKAVFPFRSDVWKKGHAPTNYKKWRTADSMYNISWATDFEPYIVVSSNVTRYDVRFLGFGWNKVSHIMELNAQNYEWIVLNDAFMVHKPHAPSTDISIYRSSSIFRKCVKNLKEEFMDDLDKRYGTSYHRKISTVTIETSPTD